MRSSTESKEHRQFFISDIFTLDDYVQQDLTKPQNTSNIDRIISAGNNYVVALAGCKVNFIDLNISCRNWPECNLDPSEVCWECSPPYALTARLGCSDGEKETLNSLYSLDLTKKRAIMYLFECLFEREDYDIEKVLDFGGGSRDLCCCDFGSQDSPLYIARR